MSYLVLARKWRPGLFDNVVGQEPIIRILKNSISSGKIAHAYLFSGPRGVGKTSTARILAKALNCKNGPTPAPCDLCTSCQSIIEDSCIDVIEIDGASNNSVNDIRDLRERVKYAPSEGKYKVYIIDESHMLSDSAFNALLKTLEEPPSHVVFILATTAPKKIPTTVLSRCQHLPFRMISTQLIKDNIKKISDTEGILISDTAIDMIARASDGSMRDSLTILDQVSSFSDEVTETDIKDLIGITDSGILSNVSRALIRGMQKEILEIISELVDRGTDFKYFTRELARFFRNLLVAKIANKQDISLDLSKEEIDALKEIISDTSVDQLTLLLSEMMKVETEIRNAYSPRLALEMSLIKISLLSEMKPLKETIKNINTYIDSHLSDKNLSAPNSHATSGTKGNENNPPSPTFSALGRIRRGEKKEEIGGFSEQNVLPEKPHAVTDKNNEDSFWNRALRRIEAPLASKISKAKFELVGDELILSFNGGDSVFIDSIKKNKVHIEKIFSEEIGSKIRIKIKEGERNTVLKKDIKEKVLSEPIIKDALELFEGRIIDVMPIKENEE